MDFDLFAVILSGKGFTQSLAPTCGGVEGFHCLLDNFDGFNFFSGLFCMDSHSSILIYELESDESESEFDFILSIPNLFHSYFSHFYSVHFF